MGKKAKSATGGDRQVCANKRGLARYEVLERMEAGLVLEGSEVKALRQGQGELEGAFAGFDKGELYLHRMLIPVYSHAQAFPHETRRSRKLLMHRRELERLEGRISAKGLTLVPIRVYFKSGRAKIELGLARARDVQDKRETLRREVALKEARQAMRSAKRYKG